jgi:hypothetical protein
MKKLWLTKYDYSRGEFHFACFRGRSRSHSRKLARERRQEHLLWKPDLTGVQIRTQGMETLMSTNGRVYYSVPTRIPQVLSARYGATRGV